MTQLSATGTIPLTTGAIGTTFTVSGLPFQPVAIFFFMSGRATIGQGEGDSKLGVGAAVSTSSRRALATQADHSVASMATDVGMRDDCCIATLSTGGAFDGRVDLDAMLSDGFRLIVDDVLPQALEVGYIAWGGSDAVSAVLTDFTEPGATGNQDITTGQALNTGADDKCVIIFGGAYDVTINTPITYAQFTFGVAAGDSPINQATLNGSSTDGPTTSLTQSYCRSGEVIGFCYDDLVRSRASVTAWLSNGFRLNWAEVDAGTVPDFCALTILGGRWEVGNATTSTGTSNQAEGTTRQPTGLLVGSAGRAESTSDTVSAHMECIVGAASSASQRACAGIMDKDASANQDVGVIQRDDAMYASQDTSGTIAIDGLMDLVSFDSTPGFTYVMDDADAAASFFFYLASANATGGGTSINAGFDSLAISEQVAQVQTSLAIQAAFDALAITERVAAVSIGTNIAAGFDQLRLSGVATGSIDFEDGTSTTDHPALLIARHLGQTINIGAGDFSIKFRCRVSGGAGVNDNAGVVGPNDYTAVNANLLVDSDRNSAVRAFVTGLFNGRICFGANNASGNITLTSSHADPRGDSTIHEGMVTRRGSDGRVRLFWDGVQVASATGPTGDLSHPGGTGGSPNDRYHAVGIEKLYVEEGIALRLFELLRTEKRIVARRRPGTQLEHARAVGLRS